MLLSRSTPHWHQLTSKPFQNLSKAKSGKEGAFVKHGNSTLHCDAAYAAKTFLCTFKEPTTGRIDNILEIARKELSQRNRSILEAVVDTVLLCGRQGLALRGHREVDAETNRGNFLAILRRRRRTMKFCENTSNLVERIRSILLKRFKTKSSM